MVNILIVEDEPQMRLGLKDNFEFEGYQVDFAEDGEKGLAAVQENSYDLIILDVMLPKISGFDLLFNLLYEINTFRGRTRELNLVRNRKNRL